MGDWKQKIEAQAEHLRHAANYYDNEGRPDETIMGVAAGSLKVLLDVAEAADYARTARVMTNTHLHKLDAALDKLREAE
jgi:hypothetical protein